MFALILAAALPTLSGDFDGDGLPDLASIAPKDGGYVLLVQRAAAEAPDTLMAFSDPASFYMRLQAPGSYRTWCGKAGECGRGERRRVEVEGDVLGFGTVEASSAVALWTGERFEVEWLSD